VGGRDHRKGQLRVLGSPSALRTKEPRTGGPPPRPPGGGGGVSWARFVVVVAKARPWYIPEGTKTGLWAPRVNRSRSSYYQLGVRTTALRTTYYVLPVQLPGRAPAPLFEEGGA
jgi:hypothetical protein